MNVEVKKLPESKVEITVTLPWEEWKKHESHAVSHMAENINLSGFRKGKVPQAMLEKRFGREAILVETAEHAVHESYSKAIIQAKAEAIGRPEVKFDAVKEGEHLVYTITTDVLPQVKLGNWRKDVQKANKSAKEKKIETPDEEVKKEIERLASMRAKIVTVNREARKGDNVEIDFAVLQNGVPVEGGAGKKHGLVIGSNVFIPGFEDALIGMKAGEEKTLELEFPADYHAKNLAGKPATFNVKLLLVQEREVPEINDEFVKNLGKFESLEALKENLRNAIVEEKKHEAKEAHRTAILDVLVSQAELEYPQVLVKEEEERMLRQFQNQIESMGFAWEAYLQQMKKTEDDLRKEWESQAKKRIAAELILQKVAADEEVTVDSAAVEAEMNKVFQHYKNVKDIEKKLDMTKLYASVQGQLLNDKVLSWLESL